MSDPFEFAENLGKYVNRASYTPGQLARLSGIPQATIINWLNGRVKKPRQRDGLLKLAAILHLSESETTGLLQSAGHPTIEELIVLANEVERELLAAWSGSVEKRRQAPFQAISDLPYFVGREQELQELQNTLLNGQSVAICSLQGMGGVGKTVLAVRAAYLLRSHFPDGVLWARVDRADTMSVLNAFAHAYGRDTSQYIDVESRSQVVRELLAHKRALIILDNVMSSEAVRPLLPPTGACAVIITTRRHDLSVTQGIPSLPVAEFNKEKQEALALFERFLGASQVQKERHTLLAIADLLGHLPLAIAIVASRLAYEPGWQAVGFLRRLQRKKRRLQELTYDDQDVQLSFELSYEALPAVHQHVFATLGAFGGEDFSVEAAAHTAQLSLTRAHDSLRKLYTLSLVQAGRPTRYRLHPLLREYAQQKITTPDVFRHMAQYFVDYTKEHEMDFEALALEATNVVAALEVSVAQELPDITVEGANAFFVFLSAQGLYALAEQQLNQAQIAAKALGDVVALMRTLKNLGHVARGFGQYEAAERYLQEGLTLNEPDEHPQLFCAFLTELGTIKALRADYAAAQTCFQKSLRIARPLQDKQLLANNLKGLGIVSLKFGHYAQADVYLQEGLQLATDIQDREQAGTLLVNLGVLAFEQAAYDQAENYYLQALAIHRQIGKRIGISIALSNLSNIAALQGKYKKADTYLQEALALAREVEDRTTISTLLWRLGRLAYNRSQPVLAESYFQDSLLLARAIGNRENVVLTLKELAVLADAQGNFSRAAACFTEAIVLSREIGRSRLLCLMLNTWGECCLKHKKWEEVIQAFTESLVTSQAIDDKFMEEYRGIALYGLAQVSAAQNDRAEACRIGRQSLAILRNLAHTKTDEVEHWLEMLCC